MLAAALLAAGSALADDGRQSMLATWGDFGDGAPCLRAVGAAAAECAVAALAARAACAAQGAAACDAAALNARLAAVRGAALDAVERGCATLPALAGHDLATLLRDTVRACRALEQGALDPPAAARAGADAACVAGTGSAATRLALRAAREWRRVFDHLASRTLATARKEAMVAAAAERIRRATRAASRVVAARCGAEFAAAYAQPPAALLARVAESGRCFAEAAYGQPAVTCAAVEAVAAPALSGACSGGSAAGYPCLNVDLGAYLPFSSIGGGQGNDVWGWTDPVSGAEIALMGRTNGMSLVDVSDPTQPVYLGTLPPHSSNSTWRGIKAYADHAFVVSEAGGHGMQIFDLTQLRDRTALPRTYTETAYYGGFSNCHTLALNTATGFAYAAGTNTCSGGLHIVDVRDPRHPLFAGCVANDGYTHETQCVTYAGPDTTYTGRQICFSSNTDTLTLVDVTDAAAPSQLSRTGYSGRGYTHQGWLTDDQRWFLMDDELDEETFGHHTRTIIWDVRDLDAPRVLNEYFGPTTATDHNLYIARGHAFEANYRAGLRILDLAQVASGALQEVAFFDVFPASDAVGYAGSWSNYPFFASGTVLIGGIESGLFVVRPTLTADDTTPSPVPTATPRPPTATRTATRTATLTRTATATRTATPIPSIVVQPIAAPLAIGGSLGLDGSGFTAGSVVMLFVATANGAQSVGPLTPSQWTPTSLSVALPTSIPLGNGFVTLVVVNTDQGWAQSNAVSQLLVGAAGSGLPTILSLDSVAVAAVDPNVPTALAPVVLMPGATLTIGGAGFAAPLVNLFSAAGNRGPLTPQPGGDATTVTVVIPADAPTGPGAVQLVNAPYAGAVVSNAVAVALGARIAITAVSQSGAVVTVDGTGFSSLTVINLFASSGAGVVNLGGLDGAGQARLPLTVSSADQFTFTLPPGTQPGPAYVQAINPPYIPFSSTGSDPDGAFTVVP